MSPNSSQLLTFLLNATWQVPVLALLAMGITKLMRNSPAAYRHWVWVAALVASLVLPAASSMRPRRSAAHVAPIDFRPVPVVSSGTAPAPDVAEQPQRRSVSLASSVAAMVTAAYALFLGYVFACLFRAWRRVSQLKRQSLAPEMPPAVQRVWKRCEEAFGLSGIKLRTSATLAGPATAGRTIVLPKAMLEETSEDVLLTAIGHEMAHIARHDFAWNVACELLAAPVRFQPALRPILRAIRETRELACDELVTERLMEPAAYARSIVQIAAAGVNRAGYALGVTDGDILEQRVRRLMHGHKAIARNARLWLASGLTAVTVGAVIVSGLAIDAHAQSAADPDIAQGRQAYDAKNFDLAVAHFNNAVRVDESNIEARLLLARSLMASYMAAGAQAGNPLLGESRKQYEAVLQRDARNQVALHGLITIATQEKQPAKMFELAEKLIAIDANDPSALYRFGVAAWSLVYPDYQQEKARQLVREEQHFLPDATSRQILREKHGAKLEDGIAALRRAIDNDPNFDAAMAYLNLLYRLKGGIGETEAESRQFIAEADQWVGRAVKIKQARGNQPGRDAATFVPAPPPPPPPPSDRGMSLPVGEQPMPQARNTIEAPLPFWQVSSHVNLPGRVLFQQLRAKDLPARMILPRGSDKVLVMVGPYPDDAALAKAKEQIERAGFKPLRVW